MNHYETLGVGPKASDDEIHEAYLGLVSQPSRSLCCIQAP